MLRELRVKEKLTQEDLAELLGCTPQQISAIELGKANLTVKKAKELASLFGVPWADFFPDNTSISESEGLDNE